VIQTGGKILLPEIHKLINSILNTEELHDQWKNSTIIQIYKMGDKIDCSNYCGTSLFSTSYKNCNQCPLKDRSSRG
jgi:anaerobic ribonucleoside-triphosphate reductase